MNQYYYIVFVYFNNMILLFEFRIIEYTHLTDPKSKSKNILHFTVTQLRVQSRFARSITNILKMMKRLEPSIGDDKMLC